MTRAELARLARETIERRRQTAETAAQARRDEIYARLPELARLDAMQGAAGAAAARFATLGEKTAAEQRLAEVKDIAARKELLLMQNGLPARYLQPAYICADCGDSGRTRQGGVCKCVHEEMRRLRRGEVNDFGPLAKCRFESFSLDRYPFSMEGMAVSPRVLMENILRDCYDYAEDFGPHSISLFMFGDAGLGKTHLALSIANVVLEKGYDVIYVSAQRTFAELSADRYSGESTLFESMLEADLLVLDDLGTEYIDAYVLSRLYELVNSRFNKPTIYTTNICKQELLDMRYTEKITSRLLGNCHRLRFYGNDIRLQK